MASKREWKRRACDVAAKLLTVGDDFDAVLVGECVNEADEGRMRAALADLADEMLRRARHADSAAIAPRSPWKPPDPKSPKARWSGE